MSHQMSDDRSPEGPTVQVRVRDSGKKDKVVIEKDVAEGLPPGWIKEIKVKKRGRKCRRDPYYTDPISGYVFRSMKDVLRYLKTGELGRLAIKPKDKAMDDMDLEDDQISLPEVSKKQILHASGTRRQSSRIHNLKLQEGMQDEHILPSEQTPEQYAARVLPEEMSCPNVSEAGSADKIEGTVDIVRHVLVSAPKVGFLPEKQPLKDVSISKMGKMGQCKSKAKYTNLPRRSSKRLAGLEINPMMKSSSPDQPVPIENSGTADASPTDVSAPANEAHGASQQLDQIEALPKVKCTQRMLSTTDIVNFSKSQHSFADSTNPEGLSIVKTESDVQGKKTCTSVLSLSSIGVSEEISGKIENDIHVDDNPGSPLNLPFGDLMSDPCIEFAVRTLTGRDFDINGGPEVPPVSNSDNLYSVNSATLTNQEMNGTNLEMENRANEKKIMFLSSHLGSPSIPEEDARKVETERNTRKNPEAHLDLLIGDLWADPCISFAVKTLTGAIPLEYDIDVQDYFQLQCSSSQTQASSNSTLSHVGVDNVFQPDFLCQQLDASNGLIFAQQNPEEPALPLNGSVRLQNSGRSHLHQHSEKR